MDGKKIITAIILLIPILCFHNFGRGVWHPVYLKIAGKKTVADVMGKYAEEARARLKPYFERANTSWPPAKMVLVGIKDEKTLELWSDEGEKKTLIRKYPIRAASGGPGPKLNEGDGQVPEGVYKIVALNPNSSYHLSMKLNYPNMLDLKYAEKEGRTEPGSDIFIHGKDVSVGCLAMGDEAIEELFVLIHQVGKENVKVVIAPYDFRKKSIEYSHAGEIAWLPILYADINNELSVLKTDLNKEYLKNNGGWFSEAGN